MGTIGDMLNDVPEPEAVTEEVTEQPAAHEEAKPETAERPRGPDGKFISKETGVEPTAEAAEPVPPTEQTDRLPQAEYAALRDERRKRQELEQRLAAIEAQQLQAPPQGLTPQQEVDFWDDPKAFMSNMTGQLRNQILNDLRHEQHIERLNTSEAAARSKYADYDEKFAAFSQAVQLNPRLAQELSRAPDPGEFAYGRGKTALEIERHGSIDALLAAERLKWEAEVKAAIQPQTRLPSTTAADGSVGARTGPEWAGPAPLSQMIG